MARFFSPALVPLVSLVLLLRSGASSAQHTLSAGSSLSVEDHERPFLVSPDATFSCGFLPAVHVDNAFYFSVWFTAAKNRTAVWTANPGAPVNGRASRISFGHDGVLALADANGTTVWNSKTGGNKRLASFDWPTDTLLPSQTLSKDKKLVAGYYTLYYDNDNVLRLLYDGPEIASIYWLDPDLGVFGSGRTNYNSSRVGVLDDAGVFLSSDNLRAEATDLGVAGAKRRLTVEQDGNLRMYSLDAAGGWTVTWAALKQPCSVHGLCGKNAICEYQPSLRCSCAPGFTANCSGAVAPERFKFVKVAYTDFYGYDLGFNQSVTFQYCKSICLNTCSCIAFSYRTDGQGRCYPKGLLFNGYTSPAFPGSIYLKVPGDLNATAPTPSAGLDCNHNGSGAAIVSPYAYTYGVPSGHTSWSYVFAFAAALGFLELLLFLVAMAWWFLSGHESIPFPSSLEASGYRLILGTQFRRFTYRELETATGNFNEELGRGGSGVVYRGVLDHRGGDMHLFGEDIGKALAWGERFKIALGAARGLAYLHHECLEWVIHCDVKPENILLTRNLDPKISDFGLAKLAGRKAIGDGVQLSHMRGTTGYMAPEWALSLPVDAKSPLLDIAPDCRENIIHPRCFFPENAVVPFPPQFPGDHDDQRSDSAPASGSSLVDEELASLCRAEPRRRDWCQRRAA
ncbi:hypothetical protein CFC21_003659 [Triticum aestivum]|uniref:non-specific serine/threonine protein kinase n=1 Tax=Triticum aestivum TaxID=4565 RepID=A0A3B5Y4W4_WHEAT|nr:hypothetical protein CFC21_003657 [Triticum aestivum]KAF6985840.1 hypothetical protein CFC21_003658 [Triticum aestivum]KAF6985841.1 hypothetical protein CFC21_003659 [Triticum aestivum]